MKKIMVEMIDGGMVDYRDNSFFYSGCETCDYGSEYITEINITLTNHKIAVETNQMYEYAISEGDMLKILLSNYDAIKLMTENEFCYWLKSQLLEIVGDEDVLKKYSVTYLSYE